MKPQMKPQLHSGSGDQWPAVGRTRRMPHWPSDSFDGRELGMDSGIPLDAGRFEKYTTPPPLPEQERHAEPAAEPDFANMSISSLDKAVGSVAMRLNCDNYLLLAYVAELERRHAWSEFGCLSGAHYLNWRCGIALGAAREKMRTALALNTLPLISQAFRRGRLSYSKVRALTRIATFDNEAGLLKIALKCTASHVEHHVRRQCQADAARDPAALYQSRRCDGFWNDRGMWVVYAEMTAEQGAVFRKAMDRGIEDLGAPGHDASDQERAALRCDALAHALEGFLEQGGGKGRTAERFMVHLDASAEALVAKATDVAAPAPLATLENDGPPLSPQTLRRLCCDASMVVHAATPDGAPPRRTRTIPAWLRRKVLRRDTGCRFSGCTNTRFVDVHHVVHWAVGGDTTPGNLVTLCRRHHTLVHELGYRIEDGDGDVNGKRFRFFPPQGGRELEAAGDGRSRGVFYAAPPGSVQACVTACRCPATG